MREQIISLPAASEDIEEYQSEYEFVSNDDWVWVYELYHRKTPALPKGRMLMYADRDTVFFDGDNLYGCIPVRAMVPEPIARWSLGYPMFSNLLPAQEMMDHTFSAIATNHAAHAVQNVAVPRGANLGVQDILGMNFFSYTPQNVPGGGKPEAIQLTKSSPEVWKFIDLLKAHMLELSNINSALRGAPPPGVTSGTAIATLTTNAIEFISSAAMAYNDAVEEVVMDGINAYRRFAKTKRLVQMTGKRFESYTKEFQAEELEPIKQVKLTRVNPVMQTLAGRMELAEKMTASGLVKSPQEYLSIMEGEDPERMSDTERSENDLYEQENERLMEGEQVVALATDDHATHIRAHAGLLNDPMVRLESDKLEAILEHINEHAELAKTTDPFLTAMVRTGQAAQQPAPDGPSRAPGRRRRSEPRGSGRTRRTDDRDGPGGLPGP